MRPRSSTNTSPPLNHSRGQAGGQGRGAPHPRRGCLFWGARRRAVVVGVGAAGAVCDLGVHHLQGPVTVRAFIPLLDV